MRAPNFLKTAKHVHPRVRTEAEYRQLQAVFLQRQRAAYAHLADLQVHPAPASAEAFISDGKLLVECECGNCPAVAPGWGAAPECDVERDRLALALCFECGAVFEAIVLPADLDAIAAALLVRPKLSDRYWSPDVSVEALRQGNLAAGLPARLEDR